MCLRNIRNRSFRELRPRDSLSGRVLLLGNPRAHVFDSKEEGLYLLKMVRKAASVNEMFYSRLLGVEDVVMEVWWHEKKISYQSIGDVYYMQQRAEWTGAEYAIM